MHWKEPISSQRIGEAIQMLTNFKSAIVLDHYQGFCLIPIDKKKLYTTVLLLGGNAYNGLPLSVTCAPDIFQPIMMELLRDLECIFVYIDDIFIIQKVDESEADHIKKIEQCLECFDTKGFSANLRKSFFMQKEADYLDYLLTTDGLKPQPA